MTGVEGVTGVSGDEVVERLDGLHAAVEAGRGRVDDDVVTDATKAAERARERLRLSASHTVVALAGATGSGKSSVFNALIGLDLAAVGVKRPTTSWATACAWDPSGAADLLEWLGVPARHQVSRMSMLDTSAEDLEMEGLVLLDLPDHDSTEVSHHLEVDRLVQYADLIVWVLDPQKYADAALHERYLRPHATHADVMFAVLNQVDRVAVPDRQAAMDDIRRLLDDDGLQAIPLLATSAANGDGMPELRRALIDRLHAKEAARARVAADVETLANRLADAGGVEAATGADETAAGAARETLVGAVADATGLATTPRQVARATEGHARRVAGWPPLAMLRGGGPRSDSAVTPVDESRLDGAVRDYVDAVGAGTSGAWAAALRRAARDRQPELVDRLTSATADATRAAAPPGWCRALGALQLLLALAAVAAVVWQLVGSPPEVGGLDGGWAGAVVAVVALLVLAPVAGALATAAARSGLREQAGTVRRGVASAVDETVVAAVGAELAAYAAWQRGLSAARGT